MSKPRKDVPLAEEMTPCECGLTIPHSQVICEVGGRITAEALDDTPPDTAYYAGLGEGVAYG